MSNELKKIIVDGVEYTLPEGGSGGSSTVFENVSSIPDTPDDQKIYRKQKFIIYAYSLGNLVNFNEVFEQEEGGSIDFIQVKELPTNPLPITNPENNVFTIYILNDDVYAYHPDYGWMSNDTVVNLTLEGFTYGGRIDSLDTSNLVHGKVYLYFGDFEYTNVYNNKKITFADKNRVSEEINIVSEKVDTVKSDVTNIRTDVSNIKIDVSNMKSNKQDILVSGQNIKTLNGKSLLGSGNMSVGVGSPGSGGSSEIFNDTLSNKATGNYSHAEGSATEAHGIASHAEGQWTFAYNNSHAEGYGGRPNSAINHTVYTFTKTDNNEFICDELIPEKTFVCIYINSDDDLYNIAGVDVITKVYGDEPPYAYDFKTFTPQNLTFTNFFIRIPVHGSFACSHTESLRTLAYNFSHAEGYYTKAIGENSHAEGRTTEAIGENSHAEGYNTIASGDHQHVQGIYNRVDYENKYAHIVGNGKGTSDTKRSNAHTLDWNGNAWFKGNIRIGGTSWDDATPVGGGSSGSSNTFEDVIELPENPDSQKIYRVKEANLYIYLDGLLMSVSDYFSSIGASLNMTLVNELPSNPKNFMELDTMVINFYILENNLYGFNLLGDNQWLSNSELLASAELGAYGGVITSLDTSTLTEATTYLYFIYKYINSNDDKKFNFSNNEDVSYLLGEFNKLNKLKLVSSGECTIGSLNSKVELELNEFVYGTESYIIEISIFNSDDLEHDLYTFSSSATSIIKKFRPSEITGNPKYLHPIFIMSTPSLNNNGYCTFSSSTSNLIYSGSGVKVLEFIPDFNDIAVGQKLVINFYKNI